MNIELGKMNRLRVVKAVDFGMYLDGGDAGEILLPACYVPEGCSVGDELDVFLYLDSEERLVATTQTPLAQVGDFAYLQVAWVNNYGAFLDWGLMKDLFVPFREQKLKMQKGRSYIVHLHVDEESYRLMASAKVERYLSDEMPPYREGDEVQILVWQKTDLGFKVIVDNRFSGLVYENDLFRPLHTGDRVQAYIKQVRPDGKLDITCRNRGGKQWTIFRKCFWNICSIMQVVPLCVIRVRRKKFTRCSASARKFSRRPWATFIRKGLSRLRTRVCVWSDLSPFGRIGRKNQRRKVPFMGDTFRRCVILKRMRLICWQSYVFLRYGLSCR